MSNTTDNPALSATKQALLRIRELKQQLADAQQLRDESIAVVSMACRFPRSSNSPDAFWESLINGADEVSEIPAERWDLEAYYDSDPETAGKMYARRGAFLDKIDEMDADFFGISPREATWVDPQQRLFLECSWEAIEHAGWASNAMNVDTGVFIGWMHNDYQNEASDSLLALNPYIATGSAGSFLCGRLSYYLGLQGPSLAVDTACSSSLVALHLACQSLRLGECERAIVGGVNVMTSPKTTVLTCKLHALSPQGHSRAFDASADGYLRGEGCGVVALKRLSDAHRDGDPVLAVIRGSAITHNGTSSGLTAPNPDAQQRAIRAALAMARVAPTDVDYLEAHGTGTELGDPLEMQAAAAVLATGRDKQHPLLVGSVKTNIGHLEAAAGMAGLIKVILAIQHDKIPPHLNFEVPNPHIKWDDLAVKIVTESTAWPNPEQRIAGVSAFGMSGTNAHIVVEAPRPAVPSDNGKSSDSVRRDASTDPAARAINLLVLSGKTDEAVQQLAARYADWFAANPHANLSDVCSTAGTGRRHFERRVACAPKSIGDAQRMLAELATGTTPAEVIRGQARLKPVVAWQFTGQGSQYAGMGAELYATQPVFRDVLDRCDQRLREFRGGSLLDVMFKNGTLLNQTTWTQPALFALHIALAKLMSSWGMQPDIVMGHSLGQYSAACVAGMLDWEDGLRLIHERSRLTGSLPAGGAMTAVFAKADIVQQAIAALPDVSVAAYNGSHIVISGRAEAIAAASRAFKEQGIRCKGLTTSHAFHSAMLDPILDEFAAIADTITFQSGQCPLVCNVTGAVMPVDQIPDGRYWRRQLREPVRYDDSVQALTKAGCDIVIELGPQPFLTGMAAACWSGTPSALIPSLRRDVDATEALTQTLARLHTQGVRLDFDALRGARPAQRVALPTYTFQRKRFWGPPIPGGVNVAKNTTHPLLGEKRLLAGVQHEQRYEKWVAPDQPHWLQDHAVFGDIVFPGAAYVEMALAACGGNVALEKLAFEVPLQMHEPASLQSVVRRGGEQETIEIHSMPASTPQWTRNCSATITTAQPRPPASVQRDELEARCDQAIEAAEFYEMFYSLGLQYGPAFQTIESLRFGESDVLARLQLVGDARGYVIPPMVLDGAFQSLAVGLFRDPDSSLFLPVGIERFQSFGPLPEAVWSHAQWRESEGDLRTADITLFDDQGVVLAQIDALKLRAVSRSALRQMVGSGPERLLYAVDWRPERLPEPNTRPGRWLIVSDANLDDGQMASQLMAKGQQCIRVALTAADTTLVPDDARAAVPANEPSAWDKLLGSLGDGPETGLSGVVWLVDPSAPAPDRAARLAQTELHCRGLLGLLHSLRSLKIEWLERGLQLVTQNGAAVTPEDNILPHASQFWGFGRVIGTEHPALRCRVIDVEQLATPSSAVVDLLLTDSRESQIALRSENVFVPRLAPLRVKPDEERVIVDPEGTYLITGGLGMLGRRAAEWLSGHKAGHIVLVSRRAPSESTVAMIEEMEQRGARVHVKLADVGDATSVKQLVAEVKDELPPLRGIIHAAGVLSDGLLAEQSWTSFEKVLAPKVTGAWMLHEQTLDMPLDFFILYSSAASILGSPGQANYAMANAYLDGLAQQRVRDGLPGLSVNWGPWDEGMAATETVTKGLARQGMSPLSSDEAHDVLEHLITSETIQATVLDVDWGRMRQRLPSQAPPILDAVWPDATNAVPGRAVLVEKLRETPESDRRELVVAHVQAELQHILSLPQPPEPETQLAELGLDSLMAVELSTHLQQQVGSEYAIPPTIAFDYPSVDGLADHLLELLKDTVEEEAPIAVQASTTGEAVAIIGLGCRFPGATGIDAYWQVLQQGIDATGEIPADRWDLDSYYDVEPKPGKMYTRRGGYLQDVDQFDANFFGMSPAEARWTDPQHRMLLETTWEAFEDAGISPHQMPDPFVGVFMGLMSTDYAQLHERANHCIDSFQGAGFSHSAGVGRISYLFGFEGPSIAIDSASSSSLVAVCQAVKSLMEGGCNLAVAGGVNAILSPTNTLLLCKAGMLSPDGRCKSFSADADGFGRGEGCGVVLLKRLRDAERDGDRILAVIRGTAISHNGHSGALTAPSGRSQERLLKQAVQDAGINPADVQYLEAHGTGTALGDPIELRAAAAVFGKGRSADQPLLVGSAKANIGHLEAAGGVSGLIKVVLAMQNDAIPRQIHFERPSPHIPWKQIRAKIVTEETPWPDAEKRIAGVSALGMSGTNAHVILEGGAQPTLPPSGDQADRSHHLMVLSAKTPAALRALASRYLRWLRETDDINLADACHTTCVGRRHLEHRAALVLDSTDTAQSMLAMLAEDQDAVTIQRSKSQSATKVAWLFGNSGHTDLGVGQELYATEPVFRAALDQCDRQTAAARDASLLDAMFNDDALLAEPYWSQPALLALQIALAQLWKSWGVEPDVVFGCGVGQYAAASAAGVMKWEDGFTMALEKAKLARLAPDGTTPFDEAALDQFEQIADGFDYFPPDRPLICSLTGAVVPVHQVLAGNYWRRQLNGPVQFDASCDALGKMGSDVLVELGPNGSLPRDVMDKLSSFSLTPRPCLATGGGESQAMLQILGELHRHGVTIDFQAVDRPWPRAKIKLPTYPFQRQRYWLTDA